MVLFKNAQDRQQIKTLAKQMSPDHSKYLLDKFEKATSKIYGILTIDLHPNTRGKDRFMEDGQSEQEASSFNRSSGNSTLTQLYSYQVKLAILPWCSYKF